jgi:aminoglycoside 3-N-acetyltransferase
MLRTSRAQLDELLGALGVAPGATVMLHSALFSLGLIEGGISGFYRAVRERLGPTGTLIVPTFTYSFRRQEVFDVRATPAARNIGVFSEFVRTQPDAVRLPDPLFSMAAVGARAAALMQRPGVACFGPGSPYGALFDADVRFVAIGITYSTGLAGFMHLERLANVPYRVDLPLHGLTRHLDGRELPDQAVHYARREDIYGNTLTDREPMGALLETRGVSTAVTYGHGRHLSLSGHGWREVVLTELAMDPFAMLDPRQYPGGVIPGR